MATTKSQLETLAAEVRAETKDAANTAERVGNVLVGTLALLDDYALTATTEQAIAAAQADADAAYDATKTNAAALSNLSTKHASDVAELVKRIQGRSDNNVGYLDPFINGGSFMTFDEMLTSVTADPTKDSTNYAKYTGNVRYDVQGIIFDVHNYPIHYANGEWLQVIMGPVALQGETVVQDNDKYGTFYRYRSGGQWSAWKDGGISALDTVARDAASEALTTAQTLATNMRTKNLGNFDSTTAAWAQAAQEALNYRTLSRLYYEVGTNADGTLADYAVNGIIEQHYYKDASSSVFNVVQSMFTEGKSGNCYRRIIALSMDGTSISSVGSWEVIVS